jgi:hypothetical protein
MRRTLALKKERLTELTTDELVGVVGGGTTQCIDPPTNFCIESYDVLCFLSRAMYPCLTDPTLICQD